MDAEDFLGRPPAPTAYAPGARTLALPALALRATVSMLQRAGARESGVFWYGSRDAAGNGVVNAVIAPRQAMARGNYHVSPTAMSAMVDLLPDGTWKPLAQIHSHPGAGVEHSRYDDEMVASTRALSIVFPFYGRWSGPWPHGIGVHEHQSEYWHLLSAAHAAHRVQLAADTDIVTEDLR
jgi:hypothetical protein